MADKVIFEFSAGDDEGGCGSEFGHGKGHFALFGPSIVACCHGTGVLRGPCAGEAGHSRRGRDKVRRHMRDTLEFFEGIYDDLFGEEESGASEDSESD